MESKSAIEGLLSYSCPHKFMLKLASSHSHSHSILCTMSHPFHALVSSKLIRYRNAHRALLLLRVLSCLSFFRYRFFLDPQPLSTYWVLAIVSETSLSLFGLLSVVSKLFHVDRVTYPEALISRCKEKDALLLPAVDIFITTADPVKEPPLITVNTVLSALAMDYPAQKVSCYVSDDGGSALIFQAMREASLFAKHWVPFCRRFSINLRAPLTYFNSLMPPSFLEEDGCFIQEFNSVKEAYEKFKERIEFLSATEDGAANPKFSNLVSDRNNFIPGTPQDHVGIIEVLLDRDNDRDIHGGVLPNFIYLSREKRTSHKHHYKAGAMNALTRVSAMMTNAPFILNLDCDMYINNSKALLHSMCFFMDASISKQLAFVQFPQRFGDVDEDDLYGNNLKSAFDVILKGLDGIQGSIYCGTGCVLRRTSIYGCKPMSSNNKKSCTNYQNNTDSTTHEEIQKSYGHSFALALSIQKSLMGLEDISTGQNLRKQEALEVLQCTYEDNTKWGKEVGWMYGSVVEDVLTGLTIHSRGWKSVSCSPSCSAFVGCAPPNWLATLECRKRWYTGGVEILFSKKSPLYFGDKLKPLQRICYIWIASYSLQSYPLFLYAITPALCLLSYKSVFPKVTDPGMLKCIFVFLAIYGGNYFEGWLVDMKAKEWWHVQCMNKIVFLSSGLYAGVEMVLNVVTKTDTIFNVTPKQLPSRNKGPLESKQNEGGYEFSNSPLFIPCTVLLIMNTVGVIVGVARIAVKGREAILVGELFGALWVIAILFPLFQGLYKKGKEGIPTSIIVRSIVIATLIFFVFG